MADRPDTDAALVRRVLGYVITEDGSSQAAREALGRLTARLSEAERWKSDYTLLQGTNARLSARLSEAEDTLETVEAAAVAAQDAAKRWRRQAEAAEARLSEYEQALRFYADRKHLHRERTGESVIRDRGEVARAALSGSAGPDEPKADTGGRGFPASSSTEQTP